MHVHFKCVVLLNAPFMETKIQIIKLQFETTFETFQNSDIFHTYQISKSFSLFIYQNRVRSLAYCL